jgi:hypothetical protein
LRQGRDGDALLDALRDGDERVFAELVEQWGGMMLRLARSYIDSLAVAEEVVQEAWLILLRDLDRFRAPVVAPHVGARDRRQSGPVACALGAAIGFAFG